SEVRCSIFSANGPVRGEMPFFSANERASRCGGRKIFAPVKGRMLGTFRPDRSRGVSACASGGGR
ncbi:hypothetical protein, partial [Tannerella forsythia]|uniref:hypothetical protein n=1 Tax=Tannerella forsythia TaxID=28112 RepID=UPI0036D92AE0